MSQRHAVHDATGVIATNDGGDIIIASGTTVPDGASGYSTGCIFIDTNDTSITCITVNIGNSTTADFNVVTVAS